MVCEQMYLYVGTPNTVSVCLGTHTIVSGKELDVIQN
jgi:hypothetical protein